MSKFSEVLADRVLELEAKLSNTSRELHKQRRRAEMWKHRALNRNTTAGSGETWDGSHAAARRRSTA